MTNTKSALFLTFLTFTTFQKANACTDIFSGCVRGCGTPVTSASEALTQNQCYASCYGAFESCQSSSGATSATTAATGTTSTVSALAQPVDPKTLDDVRQQLSLLRTKLAYAVDNGADMETLDTLKNQYLAAQKNYTALSSLANAQAAEIQKALAEIADYQAQKAASVEQMLKLANLLSGEGGSILDGLGDGAGGSSNPMDILSLVSSMSSSSSSSSASASSLSSIWPLLGLGGNP